MAIQLNTLIPVGTAIAIVVIVNTAIGMGPRPTVNMWWLHTIQPMKAMIAPASTIVGYPNSGFLENVGRISDTMPIAGRMRMYTSGCPNTQKRCCHRTGSPPLATLKKFIPKLRSK